MQISAAGREASFLTSENLPHPEEGGTLPSDLRGTAGIIWTTELPMTSRHPGDRGTGLFLWNLTGWNHGS